MPVTLAVDQCQYLWLSMVRFSIFFSFSFLFKRTIKHLLVTFDFFRKLSWQHVRGTLCQVKVLYCLNMCGSTCCVFLSVYKRETVRSRARRYLPVSGPSPPPSSPRPIVLVRAALCFVFPAEAEALATPVESHCVEAPRQPSHTKP